MWVAKRTTERTERGEPGCMVGRVTVGGRKPCVLTQGESRSAEVVACGGGLYLPKVGDEVLVGRTADGENIVIGRIAEDNESGTSSGEVYITTDGGGTVFIRKNGEIELCGTIRLTGPTYINGALVINGQAYVPKSST